MTPAMTFSLSEHLARHRRGKKRPLIRPDCVSPAPLSRMCYVAVIYIAGESETGPRERRTGEISSRFDVGIGSRTVIRCHRIII